MHTFMEQFLQFAEKKPQMKRYEYADPKVCACGQFAKSLGIYEDYEEKVTAIQQGSRFYQLEKLAAQAPFTWGALTERIRSHIALERARAH